MPADTQHPRGYLQINWKPTYIADLRQLRGSVVAYGMYLAYVRQVINNWAMQTRIRPQDRKDLMAAILEAGPQLKWLTWWREESVATEQHN